MFLSVSGTHGVFFVCFSVEKWKSIKWLWCFHWKWFMAVPPKLHHKNINMEKMNTHSTAYIDVCCDRIIFCALHVHFLAGFFSFYLLNFLKYAKKHVLLRKLLSKCIFDFVSRQINNFNSLFSFLHQGKTSLSWNDSKVIHFNALKMRN